METIIINNKEYKFFKPTSYDNYKRLQKQIKQVKETLEKYFNKKIGSYFIDKTKCFIIIYK
jgi:hypothetical protein